MEDKEKLLNAINNDPDICDLGYAYSEFDPQGYRLWVIDCARHVLPIAERYLSPTQILDLSSALNAAVEFVMEKGDEEIVNVAAVCPQTIRDAYCSDHGEIAHDLIEALDAIANAIEMTLPDSGVYHEDVVYAAARAAAAGDFHDDESADSPESSDCNDADELIGSEESDKEIAWQIEALKKRLLKTK